MWDPSTTNQSAWITIEPRTKNLDAKILFCPIRQYSYYSLCIFPYSVTIPSNHLNTTTKSGHHLRRFTVIFQLTIYNFLDRTPTIANFFDGSTIYSNTFQQLSSDIFSRDYPQQLFLARWLAVGSVAFQHILAELQH